MSMIELIFDKDCPNAETAREQLRKALTLASRDPGWTEWDREAPDSPDYARQYASPTILVNRRDVSGNGAEVDANSCRVYRRKDGTLTGSPPAEDILAAIRAGWEKEHPGSMVLGLDDATRIPHRLWADPLLAAAGAEEA